MLSNNASTPAPQNNNAVISYLLLRQFIGVLGLIMPFVLTLGSYLFLGCGMLQPSISHYYYSIMHVVFMAILCMLGSFLITYKGTSTKRKLENTISNLAGLFAFGVATFPTKFDGFNVDPDCQYVKLILKSGAMDVPNWVNSLHHLFAAALFSSFSVFCLVIFQDSDLGIFDAKKIRRNKLYKICGIIIIISILAIAATAIWSQLNFPNSTFIFETTALLPFGLSWLVKGSVDWPASKNPVLRKTIQYLR